MTGSGKRNRTFWLGLTLAWIIVVTAGLAAMAAYANAPGEAAHAPAQWPAGSLLHPDPARPTVVMLLHPRCDCSHASLAELREVLAQAPDSARVFAVFIRPDSAGDDWTRTPLWQSAQQIPGVTAIVDEHGDEAMRFGAATSGQTLVYNAGGRLLFSGGATIARGHEGDNPGVAAILGALQNGTAHRGSTPVFGCPLFNPQAS